MPHSNVVGGSSAARIMNCPGSRRILAAMPAVIDRSSEYADEGTCLHALMSRVISGELDREQIAPGLVIKVQEDGKDLELTLDRELIHDAVDPALAFWDRIRHEAAGPGFLAYVEEWGDFPGIDGAGGTVDLAVRYGAPQKKVRIADFKFGAGVGVQASYEDPDDPDFEILNEQVVFYACAVRHSMPELFGPDRDEAIELTIYQPRAQDTLLRETSVTVSHAELDEFEEAMKLAVVDVEGELKLGRWCRFAPCKTGCPLQLAPLIDLAKLKETPARPTGQEATKEAMVDHIEILADLLRLREPIERLFDAAAEQAHEIMTGGGKVPGWKLVPKRGTRKWQTDEKDVIRKLRRFKIPKSQLYVTSFVSPAQAEKLLPSGAALPDGIAQLISSGTNIARDKDPRGEIVPIETVAKLLAQLAKRA